MDDLITTPKGRLHILVMGAKGKSSGFMVSRFFLALTVVFGLAFVAASVMVIYRYIELYFDHQHLETAFQAQGQELKRLRENQAYQASVAEEYNNLLKAMNLEGAAEPAEEPESETPASEAPPVAENLEGSSELEDPAEVADPAAPDGQAAPEESSAEPAVPADVSPPATLAAWAAVLPPADAASYLGVDGFQLSGNRFSFTLQNEDPGDVQAQGNLLIVFEVQVDGRSELVPYPEADLSRPLAEISFEEGPGYAIRASKSVTGRFDRPEGGEVTAVLVLAKSREGRLVLKTEVTL